MKNYQIVGLSPSKYIVCQDSSNLVPKNSLVICDVDEKVERIEAVKSHITANDYFGTLATILNLIIQEKNRIEERQNQVLENLLNDLIYLQQNYKINKKQ